jgi:hypothetical protein
LRALMRCGSLQARSVNWRKGGMREVRAFRTIVLTKPPCGEKVGDGVCLSGSSLDAGGVPERRSGYGSWHPVAQVFIPSILWLIVEVGDREHDSNDRQLGHIIRGRLGFHFFFGFSLSIVAGTAIFSFSSVQVLRTSAVTSEQFSI